MTPEQRARCKCPMLSCPEHPTPVKDRHPGPCHCIECRPEEWRDPPPPKPERKKKALNRPEWLVKRTGGLSDGQEWSVVYEGEHWALVHQPGGMYWNGLSSQAYARTAWRIMRRSGEAWSTGPLVSLERRGNGRLWSHPDWKNESRPPAEFEVHRGRMNQVLLERLKTEVHYLDDHRKPNEK